ncbi:MAG: HEAT repeat domain-containing protein [Deltaproteobacteria bacterium]|nr:HEAT repeat domain-containing protein [Deltaproteobacteria bacterium]
MRIFIIIITSIVLSSFITTNARADSVDVLIKTLRTSDNYKVRVTAAMLLSRHKGVGKAFSALLYSLNHDKHPTVRGTAALSLGKLGNNKAIPSLKKASKKDKSYVRKMAKQALKLLENNCPPVNFKGKKIYLNIGPFGLTGYKSGKARILSSMRDMLSGSFSRVSYVTPYWPKCKVPSKKDLKKKRLKGYMLDGTLILSHGGGELSCQLKVFVTTFPRKAIKMMTSAGASLSGDLNEATIRQCYEATIPAVVPNVKRFLANNM